MQTKHTPGPWTVPAGQIVADTVWARGGHLEICKLYGNGRDAETADADARLIAAAPDMLEALEKILRAIPTVLTREGLHHEISDMIDRAKGA